MQYSGLAQQSSQSEPWILGGRGKQARPSFTSDRAKPRVRERKAGEKKMLVKIKPGVLRLDETGLRPPIVEPLVAASLRGEDLMGPVLDLTRRYGYLHFMYGVSLKVPPQAESRQWFFSTLIDETWMKLYIANDYIEVDPRVRYAMSTLMPLIWQRSTFWDESPRMNQFLTDAARFGVGSGISFGMYSGRVGGNALFAFSAPETAPSPERLTEMQRHVGDLMVWGSYFHDAVMAAVVESVLAEDAQVSAMEAALRARAKGNGGAAQAMPKVILSPKQLACLQAAAEGLKGEQIAQRLGCSKRTVLLHWSMIRRSLGARSREEAVARAVGMGLVNLGQP